MADSRYASPHRRKQVEALLASNPELQARKDAENILAIREQVAAVSCANHVQSTGSQLAQAQGHALDQEVEQHRRILDHTLSAAVANTRQVSSSTKLEREVGRGVGFDCTTRRPPRFSGFSASSNIPADGDTDPELD